MAELEQPVRELVKSTPSMPAWRAALATLLWEVGQADEAHDLFAELAVHKFDDILQDGDWLILMTLLADLCAELGDAKRAERLYELLLPYRDVNVVIGLGAVCLGSAAGYLGRLAAAMRRPGEAAEHFERALAANAALQAPVCLAHTQLDYAWLLGPGDSRSAPLIDAAERAAEELDLPAVARRVLELRGR